MKAYCLLRPEPWYRRQAFELGLKRAGYQLASGPTGRSGDVLLLWNRYGGNNDIAMQFERGGGTVLVAENGYLGAGGVSPKFDVHPAGPKPGSYYAIAVGYHNGRGTWPVGGGERFSGIGVELKPWRTAGEHILICPNRSFGVGGAVMHPDWGVRLRDRLRRETKREVRMRVHPGNDEPRNNPIARDLLGAWAVYVWSSSVALHSLAAGIPTYIDAPWQIVKGASASGHVEAPTLQERLPHFDRMAWAQWRLEEIETGEPFRQLLKG